MRLSEINRRNFLKGVGATLGATAIGSAQAGKEIPHDELDESPTFVYVWFYCYALLNWMSPEQRQRLKKARVPSVSENNGERERAGRDAGRYVTRAMNIYSATDVKTDQILQKRAAYALSILGV